MLLEGHSSEFACQERMDKKIFYEVKGYESLETEGHFLSY
jgi:hypothetical protein